jgi:hypothetical protein
VKYACLGYYDEKAFLALPQPEQDRLVQDCFDYDDHLKQAGHFADGLALQPATTAMTVRRARGRAVVTDGPYAETKEILGGILVLEATDLNHAVQIMSKHPGLAFGFFEIRPLDEVITGRAKTTVRPERSEAKSKGPQ